MAEFEPTMGEMFEHLQAQIDTLNRRITRTPGSDDLKDAISLLPILVTAGDTRSGFGLLSGWASVAEVTISVPADKSTVTIMAVGNAAAVDLTTGGVTSLSGRMTIAGSFGPEVPSSKDAGASAVNNIVVAMHNYATAGLNGGSITIRMQLRPLNSAAFPASAGNIATLAVFAAFSN